MPDRYTYEDFDRAPPKPPPKPPKRPVKVKVKPRPPRVVTDSHDRSEPPKPKPRTTPKRPAFFKPLPPRGKRKGGALPSFPGASALGDYLSDEIFKLLSSGQASRPTGGTGLYDVKRRTSSPAVRGFAKGIQLQSDIALGPDTRKALMGQEYNPLFAGIEVAALGPFRPIRGLRAADRALGAAARGAGKEAAGEAFEQTMRGSRQAVRQAKPASSGVAEVAAKGAAKLGMPDPIVKLIRNDPEAKRFFRVDGDSVWVPHRRSRLGKVVTNLSDVARPVTGKLPLVKNPEQMYSKALEKTLKQSMLKSMSGAVLVQRAIPRGLFRRAKPEDFYALRMMGKGITPETAVLRHKQWAAEAEAAGDTLGKRLHDEHAAMFAKAGKYVGLDINEMAWRKEAPEWMRLAFQRIEGAAQNREQMLAGLDQLAESQAEMRIVKEELLYHGARYQDTEKFVQSSIENDPTRQKLLEILSEITPEEELAAIMQNIDALARNYLERETQVLVRTIENGEKKAAEGGPDAAQYRDLAEHAKRRLREGVSPSAFYENFTVQKGFSEQVRKAMVEKYGADVQFKFEQIPYENVARKAPANLRSRLNPKNAKKGLQVNKPIRKKGMVVTGKVTPRTWTTRVEKVMTPEEIDYWATWYESFEPAFRQVFGEDADAIMRGFAVSQANTAPSGGLGAVMKVMDRLRNGEEVTSEGIGMIAHAIKAAVEGSPLEKGVAAKLSDFTDSLALLETRGWMGHDPRGGMPVAADVWAARDLGYIDKKYAGRLEEQFGLQRDRDFVIDSPGAPSGARYERIVDQYHAITKHLNKIKFNGRSDWKPAQAQALGWATVQKMAGTNPEDLAFALMRNTRRLDLEVTMGPGGLGATEGARSRASVVSRIDELEKWLKKNAPHRQSEMYDEGGEVAEAMDELATLKNLLSENDSAALFGVEPPGFGTATVSALTPEQTQMVLKAMEPEARRLLESIPGIYVRDVEFGVSGWAQGTNGSMHIYVIGTEDNVYAAITLLSLAFDQELIQASRQITRAGANAALVVSSDAFKDDLVKLSFVNRLYELVPELQAHGHMPDTLFDQPAFTVVTSKGYTSPSNEAKFLDRYAKAIDQAEEELGLSVRYGTKNVELLIGGQHGRASFDTGAGSLGAGSLDDPLAAEVRSKLEAAIEAVRRGEDPAALERGVGRFDEDEPGKYLYHVANDDKLSSIRKSGLRPSRTSMVNDADYPAVYFFDTPAAARSWQRGEDTIVRVPREGLELEPDKYGDSLVAGLGRSYRTRKAIPANHIEIEGGVGGHQAAQRADDLNLRLESAEPGEPGAAGLGDDVAAEAGIVGERLASGLPGYREAALQLESNTIPMEFLRELVANPDLSHYEKLAVGIHLDSITGGALRNFAPSLEDRIPGIKDLFPDQMVLKGLYDSGTHTMSIGSKGDAATVWHELVHMMQFEHVLPASFLNDAASFLRLRNGEWTQQGYEDLAHLMEAFVLGYNPASSKLPLELRESLLAMKKHFLDTNQIDKDNARYLAQGDRAIPQTMVDAVEGLMEYERFTGKGMHGAKGYRGRGKVYMPETRGLPVSFTKPWSTMKTYATSFGSMLRRGQASHLRARDPRLEKTFTGSLIRSGRIKADITRGTMEVQIKASRINTMAELRERALRMGTERPENIDDIAVPVDLEKWGKARETGGKDIRLMNDLLTSLDSGGKIGGRQLDGLDMDVIEESWETAFMGVTKRSEKDTERIAADIINGVTEPLDNVVWVPRKRLEDTGMFDPPDYRKLWKNAWARRGVWGVDAINDYMKANILLFNPAYYPMNIVGNGVMLLMQQGALAPLNVMRAARMHWELGDEAFLIDHYVGGGLVAQAALSDALVGGKTSAILQDVANLIVDRYPRRAAFIYEARKLGFKDTEALRALLTDPQYADQLRIAAEKTKTAMVDFDDLSSFEKNVVSRAIFVYPWIKGATVWSARYPFEHPVQAMAFALLYAYQQDMLGESFPEGHPYYLDNFIPLEERDGMPWGVSGRQAFTFTTPIDIGKSAYKAATNQEGEQLAEMLNPLYGEVMKQITGYDTFQHEEVDRGLVPGLNRIFNPQENAPVAKALEKAMRSDEEREQDNASRLYATTKTEDWTNVFLGSLGPRAVNPEVAQKIAHRGPQSVEYRVRTWAENAEKTLGQPVPEEVKRLAAGRMKYDRILADLKKELGKKKLAKNEILAARARALGALYPERQDDSERWAQSALGMSPDAAEEYLDDFAGYLGWDTLNEYEKALEQAGG